MTSPAWDPQQYNRFERQRDRAPRLVSKTPERILQTALTLGRT